MTNASTESNPASPAPRAGRRRSRGIALTEFALILPVILVMVMAAIDLGLLAQTRLIISNVCREGGSIGSRQGVLDAAIVGMLRASGRPLDLGGPDGRIIVTRVLAGDDNNPTPHIEAQYTTGGLGVPSKIGGAAVNFGFTPAVYNHLVWQPANANSDIPEVTVIEVFYKFRPITPISNLIPGYLKTDGDGTIIWSKAVF